jgi:hypothetical protein
VTVVAALIVIFVLLRLGLPAWWLMPVVVIAVLGVSLRRARQK